MKYKLFLFDLDDTLLDFKASEKLSFAMAMQRLGIHDGVDQLFKTYQLENTALWKMFEQNLITKDHLKVERFRKSFNSHQIDLNPDLASAYFLEVLSETAVLIEHAVEICDWLSQRGELGIITNGIQRVQHQRIKNSAIAPYISFIGVSEHCGFAKPDSRFFEYSAKMAKSFSKASTIVIGDRIDTDIQGAHNYGVDACWFNPTGACGQPHLNPAYVIKHLSEIKNFK